VSLAHSIFPLRKVESLDLSPPPLKVRTWGFVVIFLFFNDIDLAHAMTLLSCAETHHRPSTTPPNFVETHLPSVSPFHFTYTILLSSQ